MSLLQRHRLTLLFAVLSCLFLWRVVFAGHAFVPAQILRHFAPWSESNPGPTPTWNPLGYDAIGQFYPWRKFAADSIRDGHIPLWNPYQFCGTPFLANSQSAVLYPGNLLFYVLPVETAFGWTVILHLFLAASFTSVFLKQLGASEPGRAIGGITFAFCAWQVSWLQLPSFLCSSCWLPLALFFTYRLFEKPNSRNIAGLAAAIGMSLLGGHVQIALYVVLTCGLAAVWLAIGKIRSGEKPTAYSGVAMFAGGLALAIMLSAPQTIPALELSRRSHRVGPPTAEGYQAYVNYSVSARGLATLFVPDFFGNPSNPDSPYAGTSRGGMLFNYAEGAMYIGLLPLVLAVYALLKRGRSVALLGALALLALLMALGTSIDALLYFYFPGFGQSGSPGRVLMIWSFAMASLASIGFDEVVSNVDFRKIQWSFVLLLAIAAGITLLALPGSPAALGLPWNPGFKSQVACLLMTWVALTLGTGTRVNKLPAVAIVLLVADLLGHGIEFNQTAPREQLNASIPAVALLKQKAGHDRIMPINNNWSMSAQGPRNAVLPPNSGLMLGLRDVQGYDSLFPGRYKEFMNQLAGQDASPPEVGNMVFARKPEQLRLLGVREVVSAVPLEIPETNEWSMNGLNIYDVLDRNGRASMTYGRFEWLDDSPNHVAVATQSDRESTLHLADQMYPGWHAYVDNTTELTIESTADPFRTIHIPEGRHTVQFKFRPTSFRLGLYMAVLVLAILVAMRATQRRIGATNAVQGI